MRQHSSTLVRWGLLFVARHGWWSTLRERPSASGWPFSDNTWLWTPPEPQSRCRKMFMLTMPAKPHMTSMDDTLVTLADGVNIFQPMLKEHQSNTYRCSYITANRSDYLYIYMFNFTVKFDSLLMSSDLLCAFLLCFHGWYIWYPFYLETSFGNIGTCRVIDGHWDAVPHPRSTTLPIPRRKIHSNWAKVMTGERTVNAQSKHLQMPRWQLTQKAIEHGHRNSWFTH